MANNNQLATTDQRPILRNLMASSAVKSRFDEILGKKSASFLSSILSAVSSNNMLSQACPQSVLSAAVIAATIGLPVNASLGFAHIVPYKPKDSKLPIAQFQMGWKGFIQLALRSGQYKTINLTPVYNGQIKSHNQFTGEIVFNEDFIVEDFSIENQVGYLLYFKLLSGYEKFYYMTKKQCEAHGKKYSQSFKKGYGLWADNFEAMALKTVCKLGLSKYGILSVEMQTAIEMDQASIDDDLNPNYPDNDNEPEEAKKSTLNDLLGEPPEDNKGEKQ